MFERAKFTLNVGDKIVPKCQCKGPFLTTKEVFTVSTTPKYVAREGRAVFRVEERRNNFTASSYVPLEKDAEMSVKVCEADLREIESELNKLRDKANKLKFYLNNTVPELLNQESVECQ